MRKRALYGDWKPEYGAIVRLMEKICWCPVELLQRALGWGAYFSPFLQSGVWGIDRVGWEGVNYGFCTR